MSWNSSMPCFSPDGERIAWSADNWTGVTWKGGWGEPHTVSYWKPPLDQGSSHQIWIRATDDTPDDHIDWFPPSYWGWKEGNSEPGGGFWNGGHMHHKHYNPSWDYQL